MRFTQNQQEVVDTLKGNVTVMAGAGSGKTTVLAHRFARALTPEETRVPLPVDGVLTITFTTKAAGEIAERVRRVVTASVSPQKGREVESAWISTIHSLCARLLRRHVLETGLDPSRGLADEATSQALSAEAYESATLRLILEDQRAAELVESFGVTTLRSLVVAAHDQIRALGLSPENASIGWGREGIGELRLQALLAAEHYASVLSEAKPTTTTTAMLDHLRGWAESVGACDLEADEGLSELGALCGVKPDAKAPNGTKDLKKDLEARKDDLRKAVLALESAEVIDSIRSLVSAYSREYATLKERRGVLDFDDLQECAVALLESHPDLAERYARQFGLVMVDEFQDTNALQMRVLQHLTRGNLCAVGDEKQSIYGWRYADVSIFRDLWKKADKPVPLMENFRSHKKVLGFVNEIFSMPHLFGLNFDRLVAERQGDPAFPVPDGDPRVECVLVDDSLSAAEGVVAEARAIAARARELLDADPLIEPGQVAVLLRSGTHAAAYAAALEETGIPVSLSAGAALFGAPEVGHVIAMLRAIAVPADDAALLALLASPLVGLTDDGLLAVKRAANGESLWSGVKACASGTAAIAEDDRAAAVRCREVVDYFGVRYGSMALSELVRGACEAFDLDITLSTSGPEGARAWGNVLKLARMADAFEATGSKDPARLAAYLELCGEHSHDDPAPAESSDKSARVMTIHASKGLEFPIVFVAGLKTPKHRSPGHVLVEAIEAEGRVVPRLAVKMPANVLEGAHSPDYPRLCEQQAAQDEEEEKRALYVACTRARELLVVSGLTKLSKPPGEGGSLIDWIREGLSEEREGVVQAGDAAVRLTLIEPEPVEGGSAQRVGPAHPEAPLVAGAFEVPAAAAPSRLPSAVSYSALHRFETCPLSFHAHYALGLTGCAVSERARATEVGSATHARLQAWASGAAWDATRQASLVARFSLDEQEASRVGDAAERFAASSTGQRVASAQRVLAEAPFRVALEGTVLNGAIDLIAWEGEHALIVDYKTGRAPRAEEDRAGGYELQARCYALAVLEAGAQSVEVAFVFVEHDVAPVSFAFSTHDMEGLREGLNELTRAISESPPTHLERYHREACASCPAFGTLCPVEGPATNA